MYICQKRPIITNCRQEGSNDMINCQCSYGFMPQLLSSTWNDVWLVIKRIHNKTIVWLKMNCKEFNTLPPITYRCLLLSQLCRSSVLVDNPCVNQHVKSQNDTVHTVQQSIYCCLDLDLRLFNFSNPIYETPIGTPFSWLVGYASCKCISHD